jgi:hypothetical protein
MAFGVSSTLVTLIVLSVRTSALAAWLATVGTPLTLATSSTPIDMYGLQTNVLGPLNLQTMEYSTSIFVRYPIGIDINAFRRGFHIQPAATFEINQPFINIAGSTPPLTVPHDNGVSITVRYAPGVTYTMTQLAFGISMKVKSPPITRATIPAPIRKVADSPYYYGFLDHPWAHDGFLGGLVYSDYKTLTTLQASALASSRATLAAIAVSGAGYVRMDFCADQTVGLTSPYPTPDFSRYDKIIDALAAVHVTVLPIIQQHCAPTYMHYNPSGGGNQTISTPEYYASWASAVAHHVRKYPRISRLEIFNEPNLNGGWYPGTPAYANTDGTGAAAFMRAAYAAIKSANPNIMVVSGALATGGHHVDSRIFLTNAYVAGCRYRICWDELSIHNYRWAAPGAATIFNYPYEDRFDDYKDLQKIAVLHGDPVPKVMLTEWGYSACEESTACFDQLVQALYIAQGFNLALADSTIDGITYVNIYNSSNDPPYYFWSNTSLVHNNYRTRPGYSVFQQFAVGSH